MLKRRNKMKNTIHQIFKKLLCNDSLTENCYTVANIPPMYVTIPKQLIITDTKK